MNFDPVVLIFGCCIWIPLMFWVLALVQWMITGDVEVIFGVFGIGLAVYLGYVAIKPPIPWMSPMAFGAVIVMMIVYPFIRLGLDRRAMRSVDVDSVERAYHALGQHPNSPISLFALAKSVYQLGLIGHAMALAQRALADLPYPHFQAEHRLFKRWREKGVPAGSDAPLTCVECDTPCPPGEAFCPGCGGRFLLDRVHGRVFGRDQARKIMAGWIALVVMLAGIPAATTLPPIASVIVISLLLAAAVFTVATAFLPKGGRAA